MSEIVYILTNEKMPGLVKIGKTSNLEDRVGTLSRETGVPLPFRVYYACKVADSRFVEKSLHKAFHGQRVHPRKEFFELDPSNAQAALRIAELEDVTPVDSYIDDQEDGQILNGEKRMPDFTFSSADIPIGATIKFIDDEEIVAKVVHDRKVEFREEVTYLNQPTMTLLREIRGWEGTAIRSTEYWKYEDEILRYRRERLEGH